MAGKSKPLTHGHSTGGLSPTYRSWAGMLQRCENPRRPSWARYGALGVKVCERWHSFEAFLADMGERPAGRTLDRIDGAKGYEPSNCRWATAEEQNRNRKNSTQLEHQGERMALAAWAQRVGISAGTLSSRLLAGWSTERALFTPVRRLAP